MEDSTRIWLARALSGDQAARGELLQRHVARLRAFVRPRLGARLRARESSQDVVQSVLREALAGLDGFRPQEDGAQGFWHWLLRTADHKLKSRGRFWSRLRRTGTREEAGDVTGSAPQGGQLIERQVSPGDSPSGVASAREELQRLERAFAELPPDWREVVVLVRLQGLSHAAAARHLGRTESATRSMLSRALARLATTLEERSGPEPDGGQPGARGPAR
jgi:RNA polymerase sigma-70 factor, ECF subfamily